MIRSRLGHFTALIVVVFPGMGWAQGPGRADVVGPGKRATALVEVTAPGPQGGAGSAFCIDGSGLFITNAHVIDEADGGRAELRLVLDTGRGSKRLILRARIVRSDDRLDPALLRVDPVAEVNPLALGREEDLTETMPVNTLGFPFGRALVFRRDGYPDITVLESKVTSLRKDESRLEKIQFDNQLNPGNSGGPVLGPDGKVVGVAQATVKAAAINFAIPVGQVRASFAATAAASDGSLPREFAHDPIAWVALASTVLLSDGEDRPGGAAPEDGWDRAEAASRKGIALGDPQAIASYSPAVILVTRGLHQGEAEPLAGAMARRLDEADARLEHVERASPRANVTLWRGHIARLRGDMKRAEVLLRRSTEEHPRSARAASDYLMVAIPAAGPGAAAGTVGWPGNVRRDRAGAPTGRFGGLGMRIGDHTRRRAHAPSPTTAARAASASEGGSGTAAGVPFSA